MTQEQEQEVQRLIKDIDVTELMNLLMKHGNRYSRRILKFFRWFCKYVPITLMCFHAYGMWDFSQHPRDMFIPYAENTPCYLYIYFMVYILPMVLILASRFFFLMLEIPHSLLLFLRYKRCSYRGMELVHNSRYDRFMLHRHGGNGNILSVLFCGFVYQ